MYEKSIDNHIYVFYYAVHKENISSLKGMKVQYGGAQSEIMARYNCWLCKKFKR